MAKTIGIISIKGGVGKTTAVSNLAASLANQFKKSVLVVDANFTSPTLGIHLGVIDPEATIHDVLAKKIDVSKAVQDTGYGFSILPGKLNFIAKLDYLSLKNHLAKISKNFDFILIDSSPNLNTEILATMIASDSLLVITTPDYPTLSATLHAVSIARKKGTPIDGLIMNRVYNKDFELSLEEIESESDCPVLAVVPHDISILEALSKTIPAQMTAPKKEAIIEYNKLAAALCNENYKDPRLFTRIKKAISGNLSKQEVNRQSLFKKD